MTDPLTRTSPAPGSVLRGIRVFGFVVAALAAVATAVLTGIAIYVSQQPCGVPGSEECGFPTFVWSFFAFMAGLVMLGGLLVAAVAQRLPAWATAVADWWSNRPVSGSGP